MTYQRVLFTGATGFVGSRLAMLLRNRLPNAEAYFLAHTSAMSGPTGWTPIAGDLVDPASIERVVANTKPDLVVHLGAVSSVAESFAHPARTWATNLIGSHALAAALARQGTDVVVLNVSSADVYGESFRLGMATESTPPQPVSPYGRSKLAAEYAFSDILPKSVRLIHARAFNHSGPGQMPSFVLSAFARQVALIEAGLQGPQLAVGNLDVRREFLHVCDVVDAYLRLLFPDFELPLRLTVNIASGTALNLTDVVESLRARSRVSFDVVVDPRRVRPVDIPEVVGDSTPLRQLTGWRPRHSLDELLDDLLDDWRRRLSP